MPQLNVPALSCNHTNTTKDIITADKDRHHLAHSHPSVSAALQTKMPHGCYAMAARDLRGGLAGVACEARGVASITLRQ
jgi:hypothetical protein